MVRVNTNFPEKRRSQDAWSSRSRRQGRVQTLELLAGWLSSLKYHYGCGRYRLWAPRIPGAPKDSILNSGVWHAWLPVHSWPPSQFDLRTPQLSKICTISPSTQQRKRVANKSHEHGKYIHISLSQPWVQVPFGPLLVALLVDLAVACFIVRMALMTYESNLQCGFNVGNLKEPENFKADSGGTWSFSKFAFPIVEGKWVLSPKS